LCLTELFFQQDTHGAFPILEGTYEMQTNNWTSSSAPALYPSLSHGEFFAKNSCQPLGLTHDGSDKHGDEFTALLHARLQCMVQCVLFRNACADMSTLKSMHKKKLDSNP